MAQALLGTLPVTYTHITLRFGARTRVLRFFTKASFPLVPNHSFSTAGFLRAFSHIKGDTKYNHSLSVLGSRRLTWYLLASCKGKRQCKVTTGHQKGPDTKTVRTWMNCFEQPLEVPHLKKQSSVQNLALEGVFSCFLMTFTLHHLTPRSPSHLNAFWGAIFVLTGNISIVPGGPGKPSAPGRPGRPGGPYKKEK